MKYNRNVVARLILGILLILIFSTNAQAITITVSGSDNGQYNSHSNQPYADSYNIGAALTADGIGSNYIVNSASIVQTYMPNNNINSPATETFSSATSVVQSTTAYNYTGYTGAWTACCFEWYDSYQRNQTVLDTSSYTTQNSIAQLFDSNSSSLLQTATSSQYDFLYAGTWNVNGSNNFDASIWQGYWTVHGSQAGWVVNNYFTQMIYNYATVIKYNNAYSLQANIDPSLLSGSPQFYNTSIQTNDNVTISSDVLVLDITPIPEPETFSMFTIGLLGLAVAVTKNSGNFRFTKAKILAI